MTQNTGFFFTLIEVLVFIALKKSNRCHLYPFLSSIEVINKVTSFDWLLQSYFSIHSLKHFNFCKFCMFLFFWLQAFLRYLSTINHTLTWYQKDKESRKASLKAVRKLHAAANKKTITVHGEKVRLGRLG